MESVFGIALPVRCGLRCYEQSQRFPAGDSHGASMDESTVNRASDSDSEAFVLQTFNKFLYTPKLRRSQLQLLAGVNT